MGLRKAVSDYLDFPDEASDEDLAEAVSDGSGLAVWLMLDEEGLRVGPITSNDFEGGATLSEEAFSAMTEDDFNNWMDEAIESAERTSELAAAAILRRE